MKSNVERKDEEEDKKKGKLLGAKSRFHDGRFFFFAAPHVLNSLFSFSFFRLYRMKKTHTQSYRVVSNQTSTCVKRLNERRREAVIVHDGWHEEKLPIYYLFLFVLFCFLNSSFTCKAGMTAWKTCFLTMRMQRKRHRQKNCVLHGDVFKFLLRH